MTNFNMNTFVEGTLAQVLVSLYALAGHYIPRRSFLIVYPLKAAVARLGSLVLAARAPARSIMVLINARVSACCLHSCHRLGQILYAAAAVTSMLNSLSAIHTHTLGRYLSKDVWIPMTTVLVAHHIVCVILTCLALMNAAGAVYTIIAVTTMELGSLCLGIWSCYPNNSVAIAVNIVGMSVSNILGLYFTLCYWR